MLMSTTIILIVIGLVFGVAPIFLRSSAVLIFLSLCAGEILARLTSQDVTEIVSSFAALNNVPVYSIVQIALLVIAPVVLLFAYKNTVKPSLLFMQIVPAVASVVVCLMLIVTKLPYDSKIAIEASNVYTMVKPFFSLAIAAGLLSSLFYLVAVKPKHSKHNKKHEA